MVHPVLFFASVLLSLHAFNLGRLSLAEDLLPLTLLLLPVLVCNLLILRAKRVRAIGILLSIFLVMFFSYGQMYEALRAGESGRRWLDHRLMMPIWIGLMAGGAWAALRTRSDLANLTRILNLVSLAMVLMPLGMIASYPLRGGIVWQWSRPTENPSPLRANAAPPANRPDIYYIILDRYANEETLRTSYGLDNREFLDFLRNKGFYVASESRSNYMKTPLSLASSLSMEYIDHFAKDPGRESGDWIPAYSRLRDYRVWRFLKSRGYTFIHMGSRWEPTRLNPHADKNINVYTPPEVVWALAEQSMLHPFGTYFNLGWFDFRLREWQRIPHQMNKLLEIPSDTRPTFTFLHLLLPHGPYAFNPNGSFVSEEELLARTRRENYRNQLLYANRLVRETMERLLAASPQPPVIVLQSDEGPIPIRYPREGLKFDWKAATTEDLREKTGILNAYYLPGAGRAQLYPYISPVNTFRIIINLYLDGEFPLLPDESYAHSHDSTPYDFFPITNRLREQSRDAQAPPLETEKSCRPN
jgi:hypothetical protein